MTGRADAAVSRVLLAPAAGTVEGEAVFFVFALREVAEVTSETALLPVPFAPAAAPGVAVWRDRVAPVIDLEAYVTARSVLGMIPRRMKASRLSCDSQAIGTRS